MNVYNIIRTRKTNRINKKNQNTCNNKLHLVPSDVGQKRLFYCIFGLGTKEL